MNLNEYMNQGIFQLMKTAGKFYLRNPKGIIFLSKMIPKIKKSTKCRQQKEEMGLHVPPFLIASITSGCNLHCAGCYSRASGACADSANKDMTALEWKKIFCEASDLGVSFILLAGGEPLLRRDVIETAALFSNMVFPIFTNGTMIGEDYLKLFGRRRNLIPVLSIEGDRKATDARRGQGAYETVSRAMSVFEKKKILFGASVTVTKENISRVTSPKFVGSLRNGGCGLLFFVEYVPTQPGTEHLMLDKTDILQMQEAVNVLRENQSDMIIVSFPGDEAQTDGCLASGRGFFHINASGGAEPCPFSPYSVFSLKEKTMEEVLRCDFFTELRKIAANTQQHGGCTLFEHRDEVAALLRP